jgi:hypothetical protein|tara:strand:+ start:60 stop:260 length:201 start_codon:yes stop_codon:yes gene_type:complete
MRKKELLKKIECLEDKVLELQGMNTLTLVIVGLSVVFLSTKAWTDFYQFEQYNERELDRFLVKENS